MPQWLTRNATMIVFTTALAVSAFLLLWLQLLFAKLLLPLFGGSPAVWTTAMVFFQVALLAGYAYAHLVATRLPATAQLVGHAGLVAMALVCLPPAVHQVVSPGGHGLMPVVSLTVIVAASIGVPFVVLAATAPLLQSWFASTGHDRAGDPYPLYAASNAGSLSALLAYPLLIEPALDLDRQASVWTSGFVGLIVLLVIAATMFRLRAGGMVPTFAKQPLAPQTARHGSGWRWLAYALVPSALLHAVTLFATTDIAAAPLLWVVPLTLYMLSFVLVFSRRLLLPQRWLVRAAPHALVCLLVLLPFESLLGIRLAVTLLTFFMLCMVCHGELAARRPPASALTRYYLIMSAGGALGGVLTTIVAPLMFDGVYEFALALGAAAMLLPRQGGEQAGPSAAVARDLLTGLAVLPVVLLMLKLAEGVGLHAPAVVLTTAVTGLVIFAWRGRPLRFGAAVAALALAVLIGAETGQVVTQQRSFFGVYRVKDQDGARLLEHGTTLHGLQLLDDPARLQPVAYYHTEGPLGAAFDALRANRSALRIGLVGIGAGATACYHRPGEQWVLFEIDPLVIELARASDIFTYLRDCLPDPEIVLGDARLTLAQRDDRFDLLVLDAFSSDAVPLHLLTREALQLYTSRLRPGGVVLLHVSNRLLDLKALVTATAQQAGLHVRLGSRRSRSGPAEPISDSARWRAPWPTDWLALAPDLAALTPLDGREPWQRPLEPAERLRPWTDGHADILRALRLRVR